MSAISKINDIGSLKRFSPLNELDYVKLSELIRDRGCHYYTVSPEEGGLM